MIGAVVTADLAVSQPERTVTVIRVILVGIRIFPDIFQCSNYFKSGTGWIQALGRTIQKYGAGIIVHQIIPDLRNGIRIKVRMRHHGNDLTGRYFCHNDGATINIQLIVCYLLDLHVQRGIDIIPGVLFPGSIVFDLIGQRSICIDQIIIRQCFHSHSALGGITDNVRKQILIGIISGLFFLLVQDGLRQHFPIPGVNSPTVVPGQQNLLSGIITVIDHILFAGCHKMSQIDHEA